ncbi:MAG: NAD(P)/FAD-dependent oxidoreductase [Actinobacteria bacterium]|nr:NAD(P)/FAD-dependent oxidoreductase [Actinomycetota bacterium]
MDAAASYDPEAVKEKYLRERDRRLVPGRSDIRDLATDDHFARYRDDPFTPPTEREPVVEEVDAVVVGAGMAGLLAALQLRAAGLERVRIVDTAGGVGGTWYWNRYPGVMCDVESYIYLPMLEELDYVPKDRYASGEEIRLHLQAIAERYDLLDDALFHTGVTGAAWDDAAARWQVSTDRGDRLSSRYYVLAVGILNLMKLPAIPGMERFEGRSFHSARWDYDYTGGGPGEPMTRLADRSVAVIGTGASAIQCVPPLVAAAREVLVFQRTPSAIGVRGNAPTPPDFRDGLSPGWQRDRMDNFQAQMLGRRVDRDDTDDGWTHHYAAVQNPPRRKDMTIEEYLRGAEEVDFAIMEEHRDRVAEVVHDPAVAEALKPYYRYLCKRPCFHDEYLGAFNAPNIALVDCPAGIDEITERGPVVDGRQYEVDCIVYATGFEPEMTPLARRAGHEIVGRDGTTLRERWAEGASSLFGMMIHGFPNLFVMPGPAQQSVVTVNYTQLAVLGASFVGRTVAHLEAQGASAFDVEAAVEAEWTSGIVGAFVDGSRVLAACTPSRINNEGRPEDMNPRNGNYGRGLGDFFGYRDLLEGWLDAGDLDGLEVW